MPTLLSVAYWLIAIGMSLFYAIYAFEIFAVSTTNTSAVWRGHQRWFNFLGSFVGWCLLWPVVGQATSCLSAVCRYDAGPIDAIALLVGFVGVTGHLPAAAVGLVSGFQSLVAQLLGLLKK